MSDVCVVTGGGSGMGLSAALQMPKDKIIMGKIEEKEGASMLEYAAEKRMGTPDELGFAIATVADERKRILLSKRIIYSKLYRKKICY